MREKLTSLFALASLLASAGLALGWARANLGDEVWVRFVGHSLLVYGASGPGVGSARAFFFDPAPGARNRTFAGPSGLLRLLRSGSLRTTGATTGSRFAGVEFYADAGNPVPMHRALVVPVAYPLLLSMLAPAVWLGARIRRARIRREGRCPACGYDLAGKASGVCPECGTPVKPVGKGDA